LQPVEALYCRGKDVVLNPYSGLSFIFLQVVDYNAHLKRQAIDINDEELAKYTGGRSGLCLSTKSNIEQYRKILPSKVFA
jgi:hypothetical protein